MIESSYESLGWAEENEGLCIGMLIFYASMTNVLAILLMEFKRDNYAFLREVYSKTVNIFTISSIAVQKTSLNSDGIVMNPIGVHEL